MKGKIVLALVFAVLFSQQAYAVAEIVVASPTERQVFTIGEEIPMDFSITEDVEIYSISIIESFPDSVGGGYRSVRSELFELPTGMTRYRTNIATAGVPPGIHAFTINLLYSVPPYTSYGTAWKSFYAVLEPPEAAEEPGRVTVIRDMPNTALPNGYLQVLLTILPHSDFTGIIVTERIPQGLGSPRLFDFVEYDWNEVERELKYVIRDAEGVGLTHRRYNLTPPADAAIGTTYNFSGNWLLADGTTGEVIGSDTVRIAGTVIPECPLTDQQLLQFIDQWSAGGIADDVMLQIVERWGSC